MPQLISHISCLKVDALKKLISSAARPHKRKPSPLNLRKRGRRPAGIEERFNQNALNSIDFGWLKLCITRYDTKGLISQRSKLELLQDDAISCPVLEHYVKNEDLPSDWTPKVLSRPDGIESRWKSETLTTGDQKWIHQESCNIFGEPLATSAVSRRSKKFKCSILSNRASELKHQEDQERQTIRNTINDFKGKVCTVNEMPEGLDDRYLCHTITDEDLEWSCGELFNLDGTEKSSVIILERATELDSTFLWNEGHRIGVYTFRRSKAHIDFAEFLYDRGKKLYRMWWSSRLKLKKEPFTFEEACGINKDCFVAWFNDNFTLNMINENFGKPHIEKGNISIHHSRVYLKPQWATSWQIGHMWALCWFKFIEFDHTNLAQIRFFWSYTNLLPITPKINEEIALEDNVYTKTERTSTLVWDEKQMHHVSRITGKIPTGSELPLNPEAIQPSSFESDGTNWPGLGGGWSRHKKKTSTD